MTVILEGADFLTSAAGLAGAATTGLDAAAELELVEAGAVIELGAASLPNFDVETGVALTKTGSVEGIGLPSFVCSFTTCYFTKGKKTIQIC